MNCRLHAALIAHYLTGSDRSGEVQSSRIRHLTHQLPPKHTTPRIDSLPCALEEETGHQWLIITLWLYFHGADSFFKGELCIVIRVRLIKNYFDVLIQLLVHPGISLLHT